MAIITNGKLADFHTVNGAQAQRVRKLVAGLGREYATLDESELLILNDMLAQVTGEGGGGGEAHHPVWAWVPSADPSGNSDTGAFLTGSAVPANLMTSSPWFFATRFATFANRDDSGMALVTGGASGKGFGVRGTGDYLMRNTSSSYLQNMSPATRPLSNNWLIYQYNGSSYDAWINGVQVLNGESSTSPGASAPSEFLIGVEGSAYTSAYLYNLMGCSITTLASGNVALTHAEAIALTPQVAHYSELPAEVDAKTTDFWTFDESGPVTEKGAITLTPGSHVDADYEFIQTIVPVIA